MTSCLSTRSAIITGAAHPKGIGRAIAERLAKEGASVWILDIGPEEALQKLPKHLRSIACDVSDSSQVMKAIAEILLCESKLDIVVNNAGVARGGADFLKITEQDWQSSIDVNLLGTVNLCRACIPHMTKGSSIINIASLAGLGAIKGIPACYTATKFAVVGFTKQLAMELAPQGITCNAICPGSIKTQMHAQTLSQISKDMGVDLVGAQEIENESIPMGYSAQPQSIGDAAVFLASPAAEYLTGVALPVAGGMAPGL